MKLSTSFRSSNNNANRINSGINSAPANTRSNRPLNALKIKTNDTATTRSLSAKNDLNSKDLLSNDSNRSLSSLSNLKGIDKRILDLILDNVYSPDTKITFNDISGLHIAKQALREIG